MFVACQLSLFPPCDQSEFSQISSGIGKKTGQRNTLLWLLSSIIFKQKFLLNQKSMRNKAYREKRTAWGDAIPLCILLVSELSLFSTFPLFKFDFLLSLFLHTFLTLSVLIPHLNCSSFLIFALWWDRETQNFFIIPSYWHLNSSLFHAPGLNYVLRLVKECHMWWSVWKHEVQLAAPFLLTSIFVQFFHESVA